MLRDGRDGLTGSHDTLSLHLWSLSHLPGYGFFVAHCLCATQWLWVPCTARPWGLVQWNNALRSCEQKMTGMEKGWRLHESCNYNSSTLAVNGFLKVVRWSTTLVLYLWIFDVNMIFHNFSFWFAVSSDVKKDFFGFCLNSTATASPGVCDGITTKLHCGYSQKADGSVG